MTEKRRSGNHLGFMIPLVLFVLFFVVCCGVLACVFLRASALSDQAGAYNDGIQLCRNQAELCRAEGMEPGVYCYDRNLMPVSDADAVYTVTVEAETEQTPAGLLQTGTVSVRLDGEEPIYSLDVAVYLPGKEADHGK